MPVTTYWPFSFLTTFLQPSKPCREDLRVFPVLSFHQLHVRGSTVISTVRVPGYTIQQSTVCSMRYRQVHLCSSSQHSWTWSHPNTGQNYPRADARNLVHNQEVERTLLFIFEWSPIEPCVDTSSMLIMTYAYTWISGDLSLVARHVRNYLNNPGRNWWLSSIHYCANGQIIFSIMQCHRQIRESSSPLGIAL